MPRRRAFAAAGLVSLGALACGASPDADGERLFREGRWFELRDVVTEQSPAVLRAAVATAFNDSDAAEELLWAIVRSETVEADDAYELLCRIYRRTGRYARLAETHRAWARAFPDSPGVRRWAEDRPLFSRPDQIDPVPQPSLLTHLGPGYPMLEVSVDGAEDGFILDTGAWQSAVTELEAEKLGLAVREEPASLVDASGTPTTFRTAVAREVVVGAMRFRDVSFAVIESAGPFEGVDLGIIGMPILLAMGTIEWSTDGQVSLAGMIPDSPAPETPNLAFDRSRLLLAADVSGNTVQMTLDTGANTTELNENFAEAFPGLVQADGRRGTSELSGVGGSQAFDSIELPQLVFTIGPTPVTLRPVSVTRQRLEILGGECCVGNAGHDLLLQGRGFSIDFSRMMLHVQD